MKYQFTMFSEKHKPISCIVEANYRQDFVNHGPAYVKALIALCVKRGWQIPDLTRFGYTKWKVRKMEGVTE